MPLVKCLECGAGVSTDAAACPACGSRKYTKKAAGLGTVLGILVVIIVVCSQIDQLLPQLQQAFQAIFGKP